MNNFREKANFLWSIADLLRGHYKQADYGKVILPLTVLRRLDFVLEPTKQKVIDAYEANKSKKPEVIEQLLNNVAKLKFHNWSKYDFNKLAAEPKNIAGNFKNYLKGFSQGGQEIIEYFGLKDQIKKLDEYDLLYLVIKEFADAGKIFKDVTTLEMGYIFEELIRKFAELSNETAGEHFTPREVIQLMVNVLFVDDQENLTKEGIVRTLYDPACGTGGMLSVAEEYIIKMNPDAKLEVFGQELNAESYAICKSDLLIKGQNPTNIKFGNSFTQDGLSKEKFDYMLSNPPFGVDWKKAKIFIENEKDKQGWDGRFGAGLPSISDGSFLFLQHMISKMKQSKDGGSRIGIVFNGSPLFSGGAGSGPSEIRKWIISNDMLEAIIALPDQLFYNTGISTYIWIVTDRKPKKRQGKVQLINATGSEMEDKDNPFYRKMLRSLGNKRKEIHEDAISLITKIYGAFKEGPYCKIFNNEDFAYYRITVERPKLDEKGKPTLDKKGNLVPDVDLRDFENIPFTQDIEDYFQKEVIPHVPNAWIDSEKTKVGYEINFTKYFYKYKSLRSLDEIRKDILALEKETLGMIEGIIEA
ncbi:SAM-dependent DNA methyltransferase [Leptospira selangorensis]|uniref:site-specific DNA-methyltransferase (adenine-specific) n=1 Tax=Leptospira selangorensis TaxID=2484982 RepID=A0A5F2BXQ7_9LEPT|nr:class I SAM-dependent DNA methyltransferase [Leptospira selangorensis]TGM12096.1 SAM-dependent DNA methyltransferase [Leptospira selangorensis]TGM14861.1 SAM-dependent DNA methyltransferase [Leptospira selangorensis]